eukprot:11735385-Alexandrium_andersonii.AAC.1
MNTVLSRAARVCQVKYKTTSSRLTPARKYPKAAPPPPSPTARNCAKDVGQDRTYLRRFCKLTNKKARPLGPRAPWWKSRGA